MLRIWESLVVVAQDLGSYGPGLRSHQIKVGKGPVSTCLIDLHSCSGTWETWVSW